MTEMQDREGFVEPTSEGNYQSSKYFDGSEKILIDTTNKDSSQVRFK